MRALFKFAKVWAVAMLASRLILLIAILVMIGCLVAGGGEIHVTWGPR